MKNYLFVCLVLLSAGLFISCKSQKAAVATFSDLDGEWKVIELNGKMLTPSGTHPFIVLDMQRQTLSGNAGCNRMMGKVEYSDNQKNIIKFPQVATTRMACPDMKGEQELLQVLDKIVRFAAEGNSQPVKKVAFYGTDNSKLMVVEKK